MLLENQILIGSKTIDIKPTKMKYIRNNFYVYYELIKQEKINLFKYSDGDEIFTKFLQAAFDNDVEIIEYIKEELDLNTLNDLIEKIREVNGFPTDEEIKN